MALKADFEDIREHMRKLGLRFREDNKRRYWHHWLYRSDHVESAAKILNSGRVLSRARAKAENGIQLDAGSPSHIAELLPQQRHLVRLYFRPRTPTQYANEGIRPRNMIDHEAHMPVPVYLLFSSSLLEEEGVAFSDGRLTRSARVGDSAEFLKSLNFDHIYHDSSVGRPGSSTVRSEILNARNSEVLVRDQLGLEHLRHIVCRSGPERETLSTLLEAATYERWKSKLQVDGGLRRLFYKRATFVQRAELSANFSGFVFFSDIDQRMRGPFELRIEWRDGGKTLSTKEEKDFTVRGHRIDFPLNRNLSEYQVIVRLNGDLAYWGKFREDNAADILF